MAVLYCEGRPAPVKIRNISRDGALVEGLGLPNKGAEVVMARGALESAAIVMWAAGGRAGLSFKSPIEVSAWLPRSSHEKQQRVDQLIHQISRAPSLSVAPRLTPSQMTAGELLELKAALESLEADLASDPAIVARHLCKLQVLDLAAQAFMRLAQNRGHGATHA